MAAGNVCDRFCCVISGKPAAIAPGCYGNGHVISVRVLSGGLFEKTLFGGIVVHDSSKINGGAISKPPVEPKLPKSRKRFLVHPIGKT